MITLSQSIRCRRQGGASFAADADVENNHYPRRIIPSRIEAFKTPDREGMEHRDIMQDIKTELKTEDEKDEKDEKGEKGEK